MKRIASTFLIVIASMAIGAAVVGVVAWGFDDDDDPAATTTDASTESRSVSDASDDDEADDVDDAAPAAIDAPDYSALYDDVRDSIVRITTSDTPADPFERQSQGLGSGIVLDDDGRILTNYHVVTGFDEVTVTFSDGTVVQADVIGRDPGNDVALIRADASADLLEPAALGDSSETEIGTLVIAIGNPFGLDGSLTTGIISGIDRTLPSSADGRPIRGLLQTDAAINPGNSGGALFNLEGEVIGINTALENPTGNTFAGIGYAVPINTPKRFLAQLTDGDTINHPRLGIAGSTLSQQDAADLGVPHGVAVLSVDPGSAADDAGLEESAEGEGDVIVAINGEPMETFEALADYIDSKQVGDSVTLTVHRDGEDVELTAELKAWDSTA